MHCFCAHVQPQKMDRCNILCFLWFRLSNTNASSSIFFCSSSEIKTCIGRARRAPAHFLYIIMNAAVSTLFSTWSSAACFYHSSSIENLWARSRWSAFGGIIHFKTLSKPCNAVLRTSCCVAEVQGVVQLPRGLWSCNCAEAAKIKGSFTLLKSETAF